MPRINPDDHYMNMAQLVSERSYDKNYKVGCVVVNNGQIISESWNGQLAGLDNNTRDSEGLTLPTVMHSESNAIAKIARNGGRAEGSTIYVTHSCCFNCACLLIQSGIARVVYRDIYDQKAIDFLVDYGIEVKRIFNGSEEV